MTPKSLKHSKNVYKARIKLNRFTVMPNLIGHLIIKIFKV